MLALYQKLALKYQEEKCAEDKKRKELEKKEQFARIEQEAKIIIEEKLKKEEDETSINAKVTLDEEDLGNSSQDNIQPPQIEVTLHQDEASPEDEKCDVLHHQYDEKDVDLLNDEKKDKDCPEVIKNEQSKPSIDQQYQEIDVNVNHADFKLESNDNKIESSTIDEAPISTDYIQPIKLYGEEELLSSEDQNIPAEEEIIDANKVEQNLEVKDFRKYDEDNPLGSSIH